MPKLDRVMVVSLSFSLLMFGKGSFNNHPLCPLIYDSCEKEGMGWREKMAWKEELGYEETLTDLDFMLLIK